MKVAISVASGSENEERMLLQNDIKRHQRPLLFIFAESRSAVGEINRTRSWKKIKNEHFFKLILEKKLPQ